MKPQANSWTVLAHLLRPQGRKGELLAELLTDFPESIPGREDLYLVSDGFSGTAAEARGAKVLDSWLPVGKNLGRIVLQLEGVSSISEAETFVGLNLVVPDDNRHALEEDSNYISDLVGCSVYDGEQLAGEVTGVQFPASPEGRRMEVPSLLEVRSPDGAEVLIPFVKDFLVELNVEAKRIVLTLPPGLLEVNR